MASAATKLVGIARMAAESPVLEAKRSAVYLELPAKSFIGRCSGTRLPFDFTVNPYRGCEYGCKYCYARYTHEFMELPVEEFETRIFAKRWDPALFLRDLGQVRAGQSIAFGTATDCYQPAERRYGLMRKMLELLLHRRGLRIGITTKSDLFVRDADLLTELATRHRVRVTSTVTTVDVALARQLEPMAPRPDLRLAALAKLAGGAISLAVAACPVMPFLNDRESQLEAVATAAKAHGAECFYAHAVFLRPCAMAVMLPWLQETNPMLATKYRHHFGSNISVTQPYREQLQAKVERLRERHGLRGRGDSFLPEEWAQPEYPGQQGQPEQLLLFR